VPTSDPDASELDGVEYGIHAWDREWRTPDAQYFQLRAGGKRYILCCDEQSGDWTLVSELDGPELLARPTIEIVTVGSETIRAAESRIAGCETCRPDQSDCFFDCILADVLGKCSQFDFVMSQIAHCPNCKAELTEQTLVEPQGGIEVAVPVF
jgi:hypothetical protein